ncbi:MAG: response regulator transcription factor [Gammaproteobacteria bacterium]|nr:response regulator transcription factor [Gammaproteobacteria bacterium]
MRLLLVEDDIQLNQQLLTQLTKSGYAVDVAFDGEEGLYLGKEIDFDIAIIDLGLPKMDGSTLIKQLRNPDISNKQYPILILTARDRWQDKVEGLDAGADDYLVKPFHVEELKARLNALLRRSSGHSTPEIQFMDFKLNSSTKEIYVKEKLIELTAYEFKLIEYLVMHAGKVISKSVLIEHIYDQDFDRDSNVMEVFIRRIRNKLDPDKTINPIRTHRGSGYSFNLKPIKA